jgi:hypothetical protein
MSLLYEDSYCSYNDYDYLQLIASYSKDATSVKIYRSSSYTKFKIRCSRVSIIVIFIVVVIVVDFVLFLK